MNIRSSATAAGMCAIVVAAALAVSPGQAQAYGYAGHAGGFRGGYGGYGGYGWRGYGWRGYGYYGGWGWGGLGYGLFFASLPLYYSTLWWGGVPYYYSAGDYYLWNGAAGSYVTVPPPPGLQGQAGAQQPGGPGGQPPGATELFAYPKNNQSAEQQASDRYECHRWAKDQTGFDPTQPGSVAAPDAAKPGVSTSTQPRPAPPGQRQDYLRAQTACLEGRGYSVR